MIFALSIMGMLAIVLSVVISISWRSFRYNEVSNEALQNSSVAVARILNGYKGMWGLKQAEYPGGFSIDQEDTGGWVATYELSSVSGMPQMVTTYDAGRNEIRNNVAGLLAKDVVESYLQVATNQTIHPQVLLGVRVAPEAGFGEETIIETAVTFRN